MRFDIITIFPSVFDSYLNESIMKRAREKKLADIRIHDLREFSADKHKKVDDRPYGGGPGMVMKIEPIAKALASLIKKKDNKTKIVLFALKGNQFTSRMAAGLAKKYHRVIMIAGHYEGVDERLKEVVRDFGYPLECVSIGPYVLTGGELPAMVMVDAVMRHIPGVLGKEASLEENRYGIGLAAYTRPEVFIMKKKKYKVPSVLLTGDHKKIEAWRKKHV